MASLKSYARCGKSVKPNLRFSYFRNFFLWIPEGVDRCLDPQLARFAAMGEQVRYDQ
jgi:hypothetical protein